MERTVFVFRGFIKEGIIGEETICETEAQARKLYHVKRDEFTGVQVLERTESVLL